MKVYLSALSSQQIHSILGCITFIVMSIVFQIKIIDHTTPFFKLIYGFFCVLFIASALTAVYGTLQLKKKWLMHQLFFSIVYFVLDGITDYNFMDEFAGKLGTLTVYPQRNSKSWSLSFISAIIIIIFGSVFTLFCDIVRKEVEQDQILNQPAPPYTLYDERKF